MSTYLSGRNQWAWQDKHPELSYMDHDRRRAWDIKLPDIEWIAEQNENLEDNFAQQMENLYAGLDETKRRDRIRAAEKKQPCVPDAERIKDVLQLFDQHLHWHPLTRIKEASADIASYFHDAKEVWENQVMEMYLGCKGMKLSWAWEYLWKQWYCPDRWSI
jgi:hypothetical protein